MESMEDSRAPRTRKNIPVFEDTMKSFETLSFLRDDKGRFTDIVGGWYQNSAGDLYHYDGVVWDNVPAEQVIDLEYLGKGEV
jgi:hypothetical protein